MVIFRCQCVLFLLLGLLIIVGCGGGSSLTIDDDPSDIPEIYGHFLIGLWECILNPESGEFDAIDLIGSVGILDLDIINGNTETGEYTVDITLHHPLPPNMYRGFDVRGIVFGDGDLLDSKDDPDLIHWIAPGGFRLTNADGLTRWWNLTEFPIEGVPSYTLATLNQYKYFANALTLTQSVVPSINPSNRGTFATDEGPVTRRYEMQFPVNGDWQSDKFMFTVDACWATPSGGLPVPGINDFPPEANCPEAYHIEVDTSQSSVYFVDEGNFGGTLVLDIEVFDWGAPFNGIDGEIHKILIESPTLFDNVIEVPLVSVQGTLETSGIYHIVVPDVHPSGLGNQEVLIAVVSHPLSSYKPAIDGFNYPKGVNLAAYKIIDVTVYDEET